MEAEHDYRIAGHFGTYKTIGRVRAKYFGLKWMSISQNMFELAMCANVARPLDIRSLGY